MGRSSAIDEKCDGFEAAVCIPRDVATKTKQTTRLGRLFWFHISTVNSTRPGEHIVNSRLATRLGYDAHRLPMTRLRAATICLVALSLAACRKAGPSPTSALPRASLASSQLGAETYRVIADEMETHLTKGILDNWYPRAS